MQNITHLPFASQFILHPDIARAADEAVGNIERMRVAGFARQALDLATALIARGPWECPQAGNNYQCIANRLPILAWLSGQSCPAVGEYGRRSVAELDTWAYQEQQTAFAHFLISDRLQKALAGEQWTDEWLFDLARSLDSEDGRRRRNQFIFDLLWVLKARAREALHFQVPELVPDMAWSMTSIRSAMDIAVSPQADRLSHSDLMRVFEQCVDESIEDATDVVHCELLAAVLDLAEGNEEQAIARLARNPSRAERLPQNDAPIRQWQPYANLLRRHAFAPALQINHFSVARYCAEFFRRTPDRLQAIVPAADTDWSTHLAEYSRRRAAALCDPETASNIAELAKFQLPLSTILVERAQQLQFTGPGADETRLAALEARLGQRLPPSYRRFLCASNGLFGGFVMLLPVEDIDWLKNIDPELIECWNDGADEITDEEYAIYGPDQDCIFMRPRHLRTALQISTSMDGDVLLLIPEVRFGEEWEAWFLGAKNPGAYRYRSFAELFAETIFKAVDEEY